MARKKAEIALQRELETQEEWEECMAMEGLWVVDVYQEWCGPCQALQGNFRKLKNELGDPLLQFAVAKADTIDALEQYRGRCEPTFLFYCGGILVSFVHGANSPKCLRTITEQLAHEHKVIEGQAERKEVKDQVMTRAQEKEIQQQEEEEAKREEEAKKYYPAPKTCTVCIVKPDAVASGKVDKIVEEIQAKGIEIVAQESRELTDDEARAIYSELENEEYYNELIQFICSGPSHVMVLTAGPTGETVISDIRGLMGPTNVEEAREKDPNSLRARYGETGYMNGIHGSSSEETAARELAFFFPNLALPKYMKKKENIQRTVAVIRPSAFREYKDDIIAKIKEAGFVIGLTKEVKLTKEEAMEFYGEHVGQPYFEQLAEEMSSGPLMALGLTRDEAVTEWREMLGPPNLDDAIEQQPNSMRAKFAASNGINQFHGSDGVESAKKEFDFFFPMQETVAVVKPSAINDKDAIIAKIHEAGFRIAARKETEITREIVDIMYPEHIEKEYYEDMVNSLTSGNTLFMVLTREDAVHGWRQMIGPTDPTQAKSKDPDSIRATYGKNVLLNAVHGSSNNEAAKQLIKPIFGELKFNDDGSLKGQQPNLDSATIDGDAAGETTVDESTTEQEATDISANATEDVAAGDATEADTTAAGEETVADSTAVDTTTDATVADTAATETNGAEETKTEDQEPAVETTDPTTEATGEATGEATAETSAENTQEDKTEAPKEEQASEVPSETDKPGEAQDASTEEADKKEDEANTGSKPETAE